MIFKFSLSYFNNFNFNFIITTYQKNETVIYLVMKIPNFKHGALDDGPPNGALEGQEIDEEDMHSPFNVEHANVMQKFL